MNYKIDEDFDFYSELNKKETDEDVNKKCMISHMPLTFNSVTLSCGHTYNYLPLYNEYNTKHTSGINNLKCPYCRTINDKLMPYIPLPNVKKIYGINHPSRFCMDAPKCKYKLKNGKNKGNACEKNGIENENGIFCEKHREKKHIEEKSMIWTQEKDKLFKMKSVNELKQMLKEKGLKTSGLKKDLVNRLVIS